MNPQIHPFLQPFMDLFQRDRQIRNEEVQTNKAFHLGNKEYEYVATLEGHEPLTNPDDERTSN